MITPEMVVAAARIVQERTHRPISAKEIWYEVTGKTMHDKYKRGDARYISNILHKTKAKDSVIRIKGKTGPARYLVKEK